MFLLGTRKSIDTLSIWLPWDFGLTGQNKYFFSIQSTDYLQKNYFIILVIVYPKWGFAFKCWCFIINMESFEAEIAGGVMSAGGVKCWQIAFL